SPPLTGLNTPNALAFDAHGNLFVADLLDSTVSVFAPGSTTPYATLSGLFAPTALAFDTHANLYVANANDDTVSECTLAYDTAGNLLPGSTAPKATLTGSADAPLNDPIALAVDAAGNLYVANGNGENTVCKFALAYDAAGNLLPSS